MKEQISLLKQRINDNEAHRRGLEEKLASALETIEALKAKLAKKMATKKKAKK